MSQVVVGLSGKSEADVVQLGVTVHTDLTGNVNVPTADPALPAFQPLITAALNAINDYDAKKSLAAAAKSARDDAVAALKAAIMKQANTVQNATGGDATKILTTGFKVKAHAAPIGVPDQVVDLKVKAGAEEGTLKAVWKKVRGGVSYEIEASTEAVPTVWTAKGTVTRTNALVNSFTSGQRISLRVRAIGSAGPGAWSAAISKIVP